MEIKIPNSAKIVGAGQPVFIIAEIGKNFIQTEKEESQDECLRNAKELICLAKEAGADAVKFQTHNLEDEQMNVKTISPHFPVSDRYNWIKRNTEITPLGFWRELKSYCDELGIIFFSTPMSRGAAMKLEEIDVPLWKVGSGDVLDFVMLDYIASTRKPIILSSGMSTLEEIDNAVDFLSRRNVNIALLHCVSRYPCPAEDLNLKTIEFFQKRYEVPIGFSDHSIICESALAAANMGAVIIEKHFSLNRDLWGSDHKVSMMPEEFRRMVNGVREKKRVELINYGKDGKILQEDEAAFRPIFRKSLVAGRNIKEGEILMKEMIYAMRPQTYINGLPSEEYEKVLGRRAKKNLKKYEPISRDILE